MLQVGLYTLPADILSAIGMDAAEYPAVGASPDGVLCHKLPITAETLKAARAKLHSATACSASSTSTTSQMALAAANALIEEALHSVSPNERGKPAGKRIQGAGTVILQGAHSSVTPAPSNVVATVASHGEGVFPWLPLDDTLLMSPLSWLQGALLARDEHPFPIMQGTGERDESGTVWLLMREVVEVKNHLPFGNPPRSAVQKVRTLYPLLFCS